MLIKILIAGGLVVVTVVIADARTDRGIDGHCHVRALDRYVLRGGEPTD
jgi:hypothetical protein